MRVLVLCTNSDEAGAPIYVYTLVTSLKDSVEFLVLFGEDGPIAQRLRDQGIAVQVVPQMRSQISPILDYVTFRLVSNCVAAFQPDVIHANSSKAAMIGRLLSLRYSIPCVYTVHGWGWRGLGTLGSVLVYLLEKLLTIVPRSRYVYVSRSVEREAREILRVSERQGRVIYNGVRDAGVRPEPGGRLRIIMVARVTAAKDHKSLVMAFERLAFDVELILCGTGTDSDAFRAQLAHWAPTRHHLIRGLGSRADIYELLHEAHVFAMVSNFEALPLSIIEAMSAAKAIVASDVGGVSELITNDLDGCLVGKNDVEGITRSLSRLQDSQLRMRLGAAARQRYEEQFTSTTMSRAVMQVYCEARGF